MKANGKGKKNTAPVAPQKRDSAPKALLRVLQKRGMTGEVLAYASGDMTNDGDLRDTYLVLTADKLYFAVSRVEQEMLFSGTGLHTRTLAESDIGEVYEYAVSSLSEPQLVNQVVGALLVVTIDGRETWLCRFSGAKMREMRRLTDELERLVAPDKEQDEDKDEDHAHRHGPHGPHGPHGRRGHGPEELACCPKCGMPYPEPGRAVCPKCMEKRTVFLRVLSYFKEYKWRVVIMLSCVALSGVFNAIWPYISGTVLYDYVLGKNETFLAGSGFAGNFPLMLGLLVLCMVGVKLLQQITGVIHGRMTAYMVPGVVSKIKNSVFEALQRLSIGFFNRRQTGSLMQRVNGDANQVMGFFIDGLPYLLFNVLTVLLSAGMMFSMDWRLALVSLCLLPPLFLISYYLLPRLWHAHGRNSRVSRTLYSVLNDNFTGARVVKAFGQEAHEDTRFARANDRLRDSEMNIVKYRNIFDASYSIGRDVPVLLVQSIGALLILHSGGAFSYGKLLTFVNYLAMLQGPIDFFSRVFQWWSNSMNAAQRVFEIVDALPEIEEKADAVDVELKGRVELRHVSFGYEPNKPVLHDISFEVQPGEMLGIVGKSGAGKSTLVNLISRLYEVEQGEVLLDGVNVKDLSFASLRGAVAMVSQETYIFMGTIAENIAYARPDASRDDIVRAAIAASAHSFICKLPDGYDTVIGTGGRKLSGGERQRLSIARAILADPQILVLDEATASVDTETERAIQDSLDRLVKGRTTISIAHRLSTLRNADRLIVLENGRLVESGTHAELVKQKGVYFKLLQLQSKALAMRGVGD